MAADVNKKTRIEAIIGALPNYQSSIQPPLIARTQSSMTLPLENRKRAGIAVETVTENTKNAIEKGQKWIAVKLTHTIDDTKKMLRLGAHITERDELIQKELSYFKEMLREH